MQTFEVMLTVTANTVATVSASEISEAIQELVADYDGGTAVVERITEID